jgi:hypothetical protein
MDVNPYESPRAIDKVAVKEPQISSLRGLLIVLAIALVGLILAALRL